MKTRRIRTSLFAALAVLPLVLVAGRAHAGAVGAPSARCTFNSDKTGYCVGSLNAFRNSPDASADLVLQTYIDTTNGGISRYVAITFNGTYRFLPLTTTDPVLIALFDTAAAAINPNVSIYVHWNASNIADVFQFYNPSSAY